MQRGKLETYAAKAAALLMSGIFAISTVMPVHAASQSKKEDKVETVYVNAGADGTEEKVTVSEWLKNDKGQDDLSDYTTLKNIENVKGNEEFSKNQDGTLTWKSGGKDIYYQGETQEELPVSMKITYYLDGKEVVPEDLAGKSGDIKIRFDYYNHTHETVKVKGENYNVKTPFTMVTTMILPSDIFSKVEVKNGKVVSDGDKNIVVGLAFPGLKDSLQLGSYDKLEDVSIPDYVEVSAKAEKFELALTATVATTGSLSDLNTSKIEDAGDLKKDINKLTDASTQLVKGSQDLLDGVNTLDSSFGTYTKGVSTANSGAKELKKGLKTLNSKKEELAKGAATLSDGLNILKEGSKTLSQGVNEYTEGVTTLGEGIQTTSEGVASLKEGANILSQGITAYTKGAVSLKEGIGKTAGSLSKISIPDESTLNQVSQASSTLASDAKKLQAQLGKLEEAIQQLGSLKGKLNDYESEVKDRFSNAKSKLDKVDEEATSQARSKAKDILGVKDLTEEQKAAISSIIDGISVSGAADSAKSALGDAPSMNIPSISADVSGLADILSDMNNQASVLKSFAKQVTGLTSQVPALVNGIGGLNKGAEDLTSRNKDILEGMKQLTDGLNSLQKGIKKLQKGSEDLNENKKDLKDGAGSVEKGAGQLADGSQELKNGITTFNNGVGQLADGAGDLADGTGKLEDAGGQLTDGIGKLADGAGTLHDGMNEFDQEGIQKLSDLAGDDLQNVIHHLKAVQKADKKYDSFAGILGDAKGSVKFIIETAPVSLD